MSNIYICPHHIRKGLQLSLNEYAILCEILKLSNNSIHNGWCVKSKDKIADQCDLNKKTVLQIIETLIWKGYVEKNPVTKYLRPTDFIRAIDQADEFDFIMKNEGYVLGSMKIQEKVNELVQERTSGVEIPHLVQKLPHTGPETTPELVQKLPRSTTYSKTDSKHIRNELRTPLKSEKSNSNEQEESNSLPGKIPTKTELELIASERWDQLLKLWPTSTAKELGTLNTCKKKYWFKIPPDTQEEILQMLREIGTQDLKLISEWKIVIFREGNITRKYIQDFISNVKFIGSNKPKDNIHNIADWNNRPEGIDRSITFD